MENYGRGVYDEKISKGNERVYVVEKEIDEVKRQIKKVEDKRNSIASRLLGILVPGRTDSQRKTKDGLAKQTKHLTTIESGMLQELKKEVQGTKDELDAIRRDLKIKQDRRKKLIEELGKNKQKLAAAQEELERIPSIVDVDKEEEKKRQTAMEKMEADLTAKDRETKARKEKPTAQA